MYGIHSLSHERTRASPLTEENPLVLSASSVSTYLRCGYQWYLGYVVGMKSPPSLRMAIGLAGHKAVETNMEQKITTRSDLPLSDVLDAFSDDFDARLPEIDDFGGEKPGEGKDSGVRAVQVYQKLAAPTIQPIEVEKPVQFAINGVGYSGQIDLVDDSAQVRDHKFVGRNQGAKNFQRSYRLNMVGYALSYRQGASTMTEAAVERDTILDIVVRTKKPAYVPISAGGPVSDEEIRSFAATIESVSEGIQKGNFTPNGLVGSPPACTWCGYGRAGQCPYYKKGA